MIKEQSRALVPTDFGSFIMVAFSVEEQNMMPHIAMVHPDYESNPSVLIRIHSECISGDVFHSRKCDCGEQLAQSLSMLHEQKGICLYMRQEGRGIGIIEKLKAYKLQNEGMDTIEANVALGHEVDARDYAEAAAILELLNVQKVRLITNNPLKVKGLSELGIQVEERVPLIVEPNRDNAEYLNTKRDLMGHKL